MRLHFVAFYCKLRQTRIYLTNEQQTKQSFAKLPYEQPYVYSFKLDAHQRQANAYVAWLIGTRFLPMIEQGFSQLVNALHM